MILQCRSFCSLGVNTTSVARFFEHTVLNPKSTISHQVSAFILTNTKVSEVVTIFLRIKVTYGTSSWIFQIHWSRVRTGSLIFGELLLVKFSKNQRNSFYPTLPFWFCLWKRERIAQQWWIPFLTHRGDVLFKVPNNNSQWVPKSFDRMGFGW